MENWKWNPKIKGSGIIECIPQKNRCPINCSDCFFQNGRSYLEPLEENLPHIPSNEMAKDRIVRMNDGNDSNVQRELVESVASNFHDVFFNTSIPVDIESFPGPVVLTLNPGNTTDTKCHKLTTIPKNLMFVRVRVNTWNLSLVYDAIKYYTSLNVPVVLTFMAYYTEEICESEKKYYEFKQRVSNSYWCLKQDKMDSIINAQINNPYVYVCGYKGTYSCQRCGNCIREYYNTKERLRDEGK